MLCALEVGELGSMSSAMEEESCRRNRVGGYMIPCWRCGIDEFGLGLVV
jgi:hypothetical protein